ncbi:MAG: sulfotransferase [Porticoccus sp.]
MAPPRSGTTLLERLLNRHSRLYVPPETAYFHHLKRLGLLGREPTGQSLELFINIYLDTRAFSLLNLGDPCVVKKALLEGAENYEDVFINLLATLQKDSEKSRIGEKTPHHLRSAEYILTKFTDAKVICVIRDGRAVVQSRLNHPNWERNLLSASRCWRRDAMSMRTLLAGEREKRVHLVRYENLVSSPESVLKDICGFLGEKFEITMLGEGGQMNESCLHPEYYQQNWMTKSTTALDPSRADAWKTEYSSCELALVEKLMSSELEYFGYDVCAGKGFGWLPLLIKEYARHLLFRILIRTI